MSTPIILETQIKGLNDLQKLERRMKALEDTVEALNADLLKNTKATKATSRAAATASGNIQRMGIAFRSTVAPLVASVGLVTQLNRSLETLAERETDTLVLSRNLQNIGKGADELRELQALADELDLGTLFNSEDFNKGFALLTSFKAIGVDSYERVTKAAADLATVTRTDLASAQLQLAKALENPVEGMSALSRSGTTFTKSQKEFVKALVESGQALEAQNYLLRIVEGQYTGAAQAAAGGYAGAVDTLSKRYRDLNEQIGKTIQPAATTFLNGLAGYLKLVTGELVETAKALSIVSGWIRDLIPDVSKLGEEFKIAASKVYLYFQRLSDLVGLRSEFDGFGAAISANLDGITEAAARGIPIIGQYITVLSALKTLRDGINSTELPGTDVDSNPLQGADLDMGAIRDQQRWADMMKQFQVNTDKIKTASGGGAGGAKGPDLVKMGNEMQEQQRRRLELLYAESDLEKALLQIENERADALKEVAGIAPAMQAEATANVNKIFDAEKGLAIGEALAADIQAAMELKEAREDALQPLQDQRELLEAQLNGNAEEIKLRQQARDIARDIAGLSETEVLGILKQNQALEEQVKTLEDMRQMAAELSGVIANGIVDGLRGVVEGTKTAQEAMKDMINNVADLFLQRAADMIAKAIEAQAFNLITGLLSSAAGGAAAGGAGMFGSGASAPISNIPFSAGGISYEGGGYTGDGPRAGGLDGRGGYMAMVHPQETVIDHREAMGRYSAGNGVPATQNLNISYTVTEVAGQRYVTEEEFRTGMEMTRKQATKDGAAGGHARSMQTLLNSRSQRAKLGMS